MNKTALALAAALATLFAATTDAEAVVVSRNLAAAPLAIADTIDGVYLNVVSGLNDTVDFTVPGWDINVYDNGDGITFYGTGAPYGVLASGTAGTNAVAQRLSLGAVVGASSTGFFNQYQTLGDSFRLASGTQYVGFSFLNESTNATNYGYLQLSTAAGNGGFPASITGYAYETSGAAINVAAIAAVPEASTWLMMGLGLAGIAAVARRRARQA